MTANQKLDMQRINKQTAEEKRRRYKRWGEKREIIWTEKRKHKRRKRRKIT